jgi:hypothetical protein
VKFIDERKGHRVGDGLRWGVESISTVLSPARRGDCPLDLLPVAPRYG